MKRWGLIAILLVVALVVIVIAFTGCYTAKKAKAQFSKSVVAYPELAADYCARTYPPKDSLIKGDSVVTYDTLWGAGIIHFDTLYSFHKDTVFITRFAPGKTIIQTIHQTDTIYQENRAALDLCEIERRAAVLAQKQLTDERDSWKGKAKKRFWIILGLATLIAISIVWKVYKTIYLKK